AKNSEPQLAARRIVERVAHTVDARLDYEARWCTVRLLAIEAPRYVTAECALECRVGDVADGIDHLSTETRIRRRRIPALPEHQARIVERERLDRFVAWQFIVLYSEQCTDRAGLERLVRHVDDRNRAIIAKASRIERIDAHRTPTRIVRLLL